MSKSTSPTPFFIPFLRDPGFVGREEELARLHAALTGDGQPVGILGLTGMGGIGKTRLAVEYCYRHTDDYPGGVFWVNAAEPLPQGLAALGLRLLQRQIDKMGEKEPQLIALSEFLSQAFDLAELRALCFDLGIPYEDIPGETRPLKARELVAYCRRHGEIELLIAEVQRKRSSQDWRLGAPASQQRQIETLLYYLRAYPNVLLVLDNLEAPSLLEQPVAGSVTPTALRCRLLFTTRRRERSRYRALSLRVLPDAAALQLLLRERKAVLDPMHPEHDEARRIAGMVGYLPLALKIAGAHLRLIPDEPLASYSRELAARGVPWLDHEAAREQLPELRHEAAVEATLGSQWDQLRDQDARLLLRVAGLLPEATQLPGARLGLLAGLSATKPDLLTPSPLHKALAALDEASLVEEMRGDEVRLHPLVRDFAARRTAEAAQGAFRTACATRLLTVYEEIATLERHVVVRSMPAVEGDVAAGLALAPNAETTELLRQLLRLLQREAHALRGWQPECEDAFFAQQLHNRALLLGLERWRIAAARRLDEVAAPHLALRWRAGAESSLLERTLSGHSGSVYEVAITADGTRALSVSNDGTLKLWNLQTGQEEHTFSGHRDSVNAVAITPDGTRALSASSDGTLKLWNLQTGQEERTFSGHRNSVNAVAITPDGTRALVASSDGTLKLWNLQTGQEEHTFAGHSWVTTLAITADGTRALTASSDGTLKLWNLQTAQEERTFSGHGAGVNALVITPDGTRALSASDDRTLKLWNLQTGQEERTFSGHGAQVSAVAIVLDGTHALSASDDLTLKLWNLKARQEERTFSAHASWVNAVAISLDGTRALSASDDRTLKLWNLQTGQEERTFSGHGAGVKAVAISPDGTRAFSAPANSILGLWNLQTGQKERVFSYHGGRVTAVAILLDSNYGLSGSSDGTLKLWNLQSGQVEHTFSGHGAAVNALAITPDGTHALSASNDRTLKLWNLQKGQEERTFSGHGAGVKAVAISPDGGRVLSGSYDGTLKLWNLISGTPLASVALDALPASVAIALNGVTVIGDMAGGVWCGTLQNLNDAGP